MCTSTDGKSLQGGSTKLSGVPLSPQTTAQDLKEKTMDDDDIQDYVRPWKRLTDEEIQKALGVTAESSNWNMIMVLEWAKKIETALLEKNS